VNPDCRDGKHDSCSGDGWDEYADESTACPCPCHADGEALVQAIHDRKAAKK
jgi:hypothetical protein